MSAKRAKPAPKRARKPDINDELRRLQKTMAVLICLQAAAAEDTEADMGDALLVVIGLVAESLAGLDKLETSIGTEVRHGN
jgi:hypothetical protein